MSTTTGIKKRVYFAFPHVVDFEESIQTYHKFINNNIKKYDIIKSFNKENKSKISVAINKKNMVIMFMSNKGEIYGVYVKEGFKKDDTKEKDVVFFVLLGSIEKPIKQELKGVVHIEIDQINIENVLSYDIFTKKCTFNISNTYNLSTDVYSIGILQLNKNK